MRDRIARVQVTTSQTAFAGSNALVLKPMQALIRGALDAVGSAMRTTRSKAQGPTVAAAVGGPGNAVKSKEDRVVRIDDLAAHIAKTKYDAAAFGDTPPAPPRSFPSDDVFRLYAVFDGHCGQTASTFCQKRLPFELVATKEFAEGNFEAALKATFAGLHCALLSAKNYAPEAPRNDFSAGCTASVALVTATKTIFAAVGDSPILLWQRALPNPDIVFKEHDLENEQLHDMILRSNMFLVAAEDANFEETHFLVSGDHSRRQVLKLGMEKLAKEGVEEETLKQSVKSPQSPRKAKEPETDEEAEREIEAVETSGLPALHVTDDADFAAVVASSSSLEPPATQEEVVDGQVADADVLQGRDFDDVRIGLSALNVWGSIGDSSYDPEIYNAFVSEVVEYRRQRTERWAECAAKRDQLTQQQLGPDRAASTTPEEGPQKRTADDRSPPTSPSPRKRRRKGGSEDRDTPSPAPVRSPALGAAASGGQRPRHVFDFEYDPRLLPELSPMDDKEGGIPYLDFREFTLDRPAWKMLRHHISLLPKEAAMSRVFLTALRNLSDEDRLRCPALVRVPETRTFLNADIRLFLIASDGVVRWYGKQRHQYDELIVQHENDPSKLVDRMMNKMKWLMDDRSCIVVKFPGSDTGKTTGSLSEVPPSPLKGKKAAAK